VVRPTVSPIQARVLGAVLGVTGFALASFSGFAATHVAADSISDNTVWVTPDGSDKGPPQGDAVRVISDCKDVDVWGNELHNDEGHFTIYFDNHEPSGDDEKVGTQDWKFDKDSKKDRQVIATIDSRELISDLKDKGFHPQDDGWHIDLRFSDPEKEVEFILKNDCEEEHQQQGGEQGGGGGESGGVPVQQQAPPPVVKGTTTQAPKAAAVVPSTGADAPFVPGLLLISAGGGALGFARRLRRRRGH
jgi:hypothetical protein